MVRFRSFIVFRRSTSTLLHCPKNLKECIDWILRATEKDTPPGSSSDTKKLKDAVRSVLGESDLSKDLEGLSSGLALFMGYPSCVCRLKKSVEERLKKIYKELKKESESVEKCLPGQSLNCNECVSKGVCCKCCVIKCIKEVQANCDCVTKTGKCQCKNDSGKCCKGFLNGLKDCLSLLDLQSDLKACTCSGKDCCQDGKDCSNCDLCSSNSKSTQDSTMTGLGNVRRGPLHLAKKLDGFFGDGQSKSSGCDCKCKGSTPPKQSCCCLACETDKCSQSCGCKSGSGCSCASQSQTGTCPRKAFCQSVYGIKIHCDGGDMTCCGGGKQCHCEVEGSKVCQSGQNCCVESVTSGKSKYYHGVLCLIRRVVRFFNKVKENQNCPKMCCELLCVRMICDVLGKFFKTVPGDKCTKCSTPGGTGPCSQGTKKGKCCNAGSNCKDPDCCQGCQDCNAIKFRRALSALHYSTPCGYDLWRTLQDFFHYCRFIFLPYVNGIRSTVRNAKNKCKNCSNSGQSPCTCSSGSPCDACKALPDSIVSLITHGYVSSYVGASWEKLCNTSGSGKCCCGQDSSCPSCSSCCQSSGTCDPSKCCDACPQRKAAKAFLGKLPGLYYGLKIVFDRCKDSVIWPGWNKIEVSGGQAKTDLTRFLQAWGFNLEKELNAGKPGGEISPLLVSLFNSGSPGIFESLYNLVSKKYFKPSLSPSSPSKSHPSTVRQILLWLSGLRFTPGFFPLVERCRPMAAPFGTYFNHDAFCYYIHATCFFGPCVINIIENPSKSLISSSSDASKFCYPEDPYALLEMLTDYVYKAFFQLNFLRLQCERDRGQAGWQQCRYGKNCSGNSTSLSSPSPCCAPSGSSKGYLCTNDHSDCQSGSNHSSSKCPHPLRRFLTDSPDSLFKPPDGLLPMGFEKHLPSTAQNGYSIAQFLLPFCSPGYLPLSKLLQFLCISLNPPPTLSDLFAFFTRFKDSPIFKNGFAAYVDGEPGSYSGDSLKKAIEGLYGSRNSHSSSHSDANLKSLSGCDGKKGSGLTCGGYLVPITYDAYDLFTRELYGMYLSWICYLAPKFHSELKKFQEAAKEKFACCLKDSCKAIVDCPCALPFLYKFGFTFHSPNGLNCVRGGEQHNGHNSGENGCTVKSCSDFIAQLKKVIEGDPLKNLLSAIENLTWSLRYPFILFVLALWSFVIYYYLYAHLYKLDTLHIRSHLHFSKSFKVPPSTLLSSKSLPLPDQSRIDPSSFSRSV